MKKLLVLLIVVVLICTGCQLIKATASEPAEKKVGVSEIYIDCVESKVNGPDWVPLKHAQVVFNGGYSIPATKDFWLSVETPDGTNYLISKNDGGGVMGLYVTLLDGYLGDIRNQYPTIALEAGTYHVKGLVAPHMEDGIPEWKNDVFSWEFKVPDCK